MITRHSLNNLTFIHILRIIAVFFVIFNHSGDIGFYLYADYSVSSIQFCVYLLFSIFSKVSVPLFFLISGALLLNKPDESLTELWRKRIFKIAVPLVFFSLVYYCYALYWSGEPFCLSEFLNKLYASDLMYHLWYMYAYIGYLMCIPFLRSMVKSLPDKYFYYMIGIALFFNGILPCVEYRISQGMVSMNAYLRPTWLITNTVLYPCVGYFLQHRIDIASIKRRLPLLWGINLIGFIVSGYMTYYRYTIAGAIEKTEVFHSCFAILNCIAVFITAKYLFSFIKVSGFASDLVQSAGKCTFGIYLIHLLLKDRVFLVSMVENMRTSGVNFLLAALLYCICIFLISYGITLVISKIPLIRKNVGF